MQVSFWHSSDGGRVWTPIVQSQYAGTGGGWFDPVSASVAYLYYGPYGPARNVERLSDGGRTATPVGRLNCLTETSAVFTSPDDGLIGCDVNSTSYFLVRTSDGGARWTKVKLPSR